MLIYRQLAVQDREQTGTSNKLKNRSAFFLFLFWN